MGADQIAVERRSDVDHVLVERREALALRFRAERKDRDPLEAEVFLLLEQERQAKPEPERGRKAELLSDEVLSLDRDVRGQSRDDNIVEPGRMRQKKVPADLADLDPDERDCVVRLPPVGAQPKDPVEKRSGSHKLDPSSTLGHARFQAASPQRGSYRNSERKPTAGCQAGVSLWRPPRSCRSAPPARR